MIARRVHAYRCLTERERETRLEKKKFERRAYNKGGLILRKSKREGRLKKVSRSEKPENETYIYLYKFRSGQESNPLTRRETRLTS